MIITEEVTYSITFGRLMEIEGDFFGKIGGAGKMLVV